MPRRENLVKDIVNSREWGYSVEDWDEDAEDMPSLRKMTREELMDRLKKDWNIKKAVDNPTKKK